MHTKIVNSKIVRNLAGLTVLAALAGGASMAQAEQVWARVVSATPVTESNGQTSYHVTYEYNGQRYSTRTDARPGSTIPVDVGDYGVATTSPVAPQPQFNAGPGPGPGGGQSGWNNVTPEPGVVVGTGQAAYAAPPPVYAQPAPVYYPAPVYVQPAYGYGYGYAPYAYPPVGLSLNLGYSRGWHGGGGRWR